MIPEKHSLQSTISACDTSIGLILLIYTRRKKRIESKWLEAYQVSNYKTTKISLDSRNLFNFIKCILNRKLEKQWRAEWHFLCWQDWRKDHHIWVYLTTTWLTVNIKYLKAEKKVYPFPSFLKKETSPWQDLVLGHSLALLGVITSETTILQNERTIKIMRH